MVSFYRLQIIGFTQSLFTEVPKDQKKFCLTLLGSMHSELASVPAMFHSRVKRIMPFLYHNAYLANTKLASSILGLAPTNDPQQQQQHLESCLEQSKPWEWLEDYVSDPPHDNDAPISLSLFNAKKMKRVENTYVRWFQYGFDKNPNYRDISIEDRPMHISSISKMKKKSASGEENGDIKKRGNDERYSTPVRKRKVEMEEGELP